MPKISIIDDDAALELLAENLTLRGHEVRRFSSTSSALSSLGDILSSELIGDCLAILSKIMIPKDISW